MFTSISSYIWGVNTAEDEQTAADMTAPHARRDSSPTPEDWVLVGSQPAPGNLGALEPLPPLTPSSASSASSEAGEAGEPAEVAPLDEEYTRVPARVSHDHTVSLKSLKSAQINKQRNSGKALSSKALKRSNKAVITGRRKDCVKYNMPIKMAGMNKNLKQC